ncbi:LysR family transcriptional regulator [Tabrizicola sp. J26]|uniref:LysR family transcriptional regulator n=1 Tax=Alitabrizicola rongguiensis TaxID=2909234 RepID=UPI001F254EFC|nr:LysR family transcriptional regulator [Tabrizicola rongguiensis]MCF1710311.1 LysR family transcriptional regulator [Tabrizicola rongguiensis]
MKLNERHLMLLAAVVDAGGVSEGAALLGLTQPAVSRALVMLEARVGEPLFQRGRRPLRPTPLGAQLAAHGRTILAASREASSTVSGFVRGTKGTVRVGGVPFFIDAMISTMIAGFLTLEPDVNVRLSYGNTPEMAKALEGDQIDLAIVPIGLTDATPGFDFTEILPGRNVVACRAGHPLARQRRLQAADLKGFPWVAPLPGSPLLTDLHSILVGMGLPEFDIRFSGGSLMAVLNYMAGSDALTILPFSVVFSQRLENRIASLPFDIPQPQRALGILRRRNAPKNPVAERFAAHIVQSFDELKHLIKRHENAVVWGR